jgi:hypothetical protein
MTGAVALATVPVAVAPAHVPVATALSHVPAGPSLLEVYRWELSGPTATVDAIPDLLSDRDAGIDGDEGSDAGSDDAPPWPRRRRGR